MMDFLTTGNSGMIFLSLGLIGMAVSAAAALIVGHLLKRRERQIREQIWQEYR